MGTPIAMEEKSFDTGEVRINYAEGPASGPPVVLLHGLTGSWRGWGYLIPRLAPRWHIFALDLRGHGKSGHPAQGYAISDFARDVAAFLNGRIQQSAVLIGHSLGAATALFAAPLAQARIRGLILCEPPLFSTHTSIQETPQVRGWFEFVAQPHTEQWLDQARKNICEYDPGASEESIREQVDSIASVATQAPQAALDDQTFAGVSLPATLRQIHVPALFLQGEKSLGAAMWDEDAETVRQNLPGAVVRKFPTGHDTHYAVDTILEELERLSASETKGTDR